MVMVLINDVDFDCGVMGCIRERHWNLVMLLAV